MTYKNVLIVSDYDPNRNGNASDAGIAGWVILANNTAPNDDAITGNKGQGSRVSCRFQCV